MTSAVNQSPGGCNCTACTGQICVSLSAPCTSSDKVGYLISVYDHTTGILVDTATTDSLGKACVTGLPSGHYDVTATKADGSSLSWANQDVPCTTLNLTGNVYGFPGAGRRFVVRGCNSVALPGATITISGVESATLSTDGSGTAYYYPKVLGIHSYTISHAKFNNATGSWNQIASCTTATVTTTLTVATGYQCCALTAPYPLSKTLTLTDPAGSFSVDASSCGVGVCAVRPMPNSSPSNPVGVTCSPSGLGFQPPPDIGTHDVPIEYSINLSTTPTASQALAAYMGPGLGGLLYRQDFPSTGLCSPQDTYQGWRFAGTCPIVPVKNILHDSISYTINSISPFNITFTFSSSGSFGPSSSPVGGKAFATTLVLSE